MTPPPVTGRPTSDQGIVSFDSASGTVLLPEVASPVVGLMSEAAGSETSQAADTVLPEVAGCGSAEAAAVDDSEAGFETVKARRRPKSENLPQNKMQSGRRPYPAQSVAKPTGTATVQSDHRPSRAQSVAKPNGAATVLVVPRPASHSNMETDRTGGSVGGHNGGNAAADGGRKRSAHRRADSTGGNSQSRCGRGRFRQSRGGGRGHVNRSRVLEVPRQSLRTDGTA